MRIRKNLEVCSVQLFNFKEKATEALGREVTQSWSTQLSLHHASTFQNMGFVISVKDLSSGLAGTCKQSITQKKRVK